MLVWYFTRRPFIHVPKRLLSKRSFIYRGSPGPSWRILIDWNKSRTNSLMCRHGKEISSSYGSTSVSLFNENRGISTYKKSSISRSNQDETIELNFKIKTFRIFKGYHWPSNAPFIVGLVCVQGVPWDSSKRHRRNQCHVWHVELCIFRWLKIRTI